MAAYNTSSAYDLQSFERAPQQQTERPQVRVVEAQKKGVVASLLHIKTIAPFFLVVIFLALEVYNKTCLHGITGEITALNNDNQALRSENTRLSSLIDNSMSLYNVAERAQEMGMQKLDKYQIEYVSLYKENRIEVIESATEAGFFEQLKLSVNSAIRDLKEYIGAA